MAITGGVGHGLDNTSAMNDYQKILTESGASGVNSEISGGSFEDGFKVALVTSSAKYLYRSVVRYDSTLKSGEEYGKDEYGKYKYNEDLKFTPQDGNTIGFNREFTENTEWYDLSNTGKQGGLISRGANLVPGMNSFSKFHDQLFVGGHLSQSMLTNIPSMIPAIAINYASIYSQNQTYIRMYDNIRKAQ